MLERNMNNKDLAVSLMVAAGAPRDEWSQEERIKHYLAVMTASLTVAHAMMALATLLTSERQAVESFAVASKRAQLTASDILVEFYSSGEADLVAEGN